MATFKMRLLVVLSVIFSIQSFAIETVKERDARMEWWREARFGMFVHWGLYSIPAGKWGDRELKHGKKSEWIQQMYNISAEEYEKTLVPQFKPKKGFAKEWASLAATAGCKYVVVTTKHHDGFSLFDSQLTTFDAKDACGRDLFKEIVEALHSKDLRVGAYHSVIDWHHPDAYVGFGLPSLKSDTNEGRDNAVYVDYLHGQVEELAKNYGPIDVWWWDFSRPKCQNESWRAKELMALLRKHQPQIVSNNRLFEKGVYQKAWKNGALLAPEYGDFSTPEQKIPATGIPGMDWETCMTMNQAWGYSQYAEKWKSTTSLIQKLVDVVSKGGNYLLNISPKPDGSIPQENIDRMTEIGAWMDAYGDSIYGTTASELGKLPWGRSTTKLREGGGKIIYLQVFDWPTDGTLVVPHVPSSLKQVKLMTSSGAKKADFQQKGSSVEIKVTTDPLDEHVSVLALLF